MEEKTKKPIKKIETKVVETKAVTARTASQESKGLIAVIRIDGEVKVKPEIKATLDRLRLRRKYTCFLLNASNKGLMGMLWKVRHAVAYGPLTKETLVKLLKARAQKIILPNSTPKKTEVDYEKLAEEIMKGKKLEELGFKSFFRLHPPRKGINSKLQYPKGVLGNNKDDINKLIERML